MSIKQDVGVDHLIDLAERDGVAVTSVTDRHVLVFMKSHLVKMLAQLDEKGSDRCVVFVKRPDLATAN